MKVKNVIENLKDFNPESEIYIKIETDDLPTFSYFLPDKVYLDIKEIHIETSRDKYFGLVYIEPDLEGIGE